MQKTKHLKKKKILQNLKTNSLTIAKNKHKLLTNSQQLIENTQDVQSGLNILSVLQEKISFLKPNLNQVTASMVNNNFKKRTDL